MHDSTLSLIFGSQCRRMSIPSFKTSIRIWRIHINIRSLDTLGTVQIGDIVIFPYVLRNFVTSLKDTNIFSRANFLKF